MSVACVIVNYNGTVDTIRAVRSLEPELGSGDFIVVVDNGSADEHVASLRMVASERTHVVELGLNVGFAAGCNAGIRYALDSGCDYVFILNNDISAEEGCLQRLVAVLDESEDLGAACPLIVRMDDPDRVWAAGGHITLRTGQFGHRFHGKSRAAASESCTVNFATGCALMVRTETLLTVGLLPERWFLYFEDTEFCLRMAEFGLSIGYVSDAVIRHSVGASVRRNDINYYFYWRNYLLFIREWIPAPVSWIATIRVLLTMIMIGTFNLVTKPSRTQMIARAAVHGMQGQWARPA